MDASPFIGPAQVSVELDLMFQILVQCFLMGCSPPPSIPIPIATCIYPYHQHRIRRSNAGFSNTSRRSQVPSQEGFETGTQSFFSGPQDLGKYLFCLFATEKNCHLYIVVNTLIENVSVVVQNDDAYFIFSSIDSFTQILLRQLIHENQTSGKNR